jgi:hypothetical protein
MAENAYRTGNYHLPIGSSYVTLISPFKLIPIFLMKKGQAKLFKESLGRIFSGMVGFYVNGTNKTSLLPFTRS